MSSTQSEVKALLDSWSGAIRAKHIDRLMSLYSPDIVYWAGRRRSPSCFTERAEL
jgi:ketosteroid isomerase-like protein